MTKGHSLLGRLFGNRDNQGMRAAEQPDGEDGETFTPPTPLQAGFDLTAVSCASEAVLMQRLMAKPDFQERLAKTSEGRDRALVAQQIGLISDWYRADRSITPELLEIVDILAQTLRVQMPIDLFVRADPTMNAFCMPSKNGKRLTMAIHSALVEATDNQGLLSIMGHEAGHAILGHGKYPRVEFGDPAFSFLEVARLRGLDRRREIACDRVGLLASQHLQGSCNALLRTLSGLSDRWFVFDESAYCGHFERIQGEMELLHADGAMDTHPIIPLRIAALIAFARSELYAKAVGTRSWDLSSEELGRQVETMLSSVEPDFASIESAKEEDAINELLSKGALLIIAADGAAEDVELNWLQQRGATLKLTREEVERLANPEQRDEMLRSLEGAVGIVQAKLTGNERLGLLRVMFDVAQSAAGITREEFEILDVLRRMLAIPVDVAQSLLGEVEASGEPGEGSRNEESTEEAPNSGAGEPPGTKSIPEAKSSGAVPERTQDKTIDPSEVTVRDVLELIARSEIIREEARPHVSAACNTIVAEETSVETAVRRLVAWAVTAASSAGPLTLAQARQVALASIDVLREVKQALGVRRRVPATPTSIQLKRFGLAALFRRGERVKRVSDQAVVVVESVSRVRGEVLVRGETETPEQAVHVRPPQLAKSPTDDVWPPELSIPLPSRA